MMVLVRHLRQLGEEGVGVEQLIPNELRWYTGTLSLESVRKSSAKLLVCFGSIVARKRYHRQVVALRSQRVKELPRTHRLRILSAHRWVTC